MDMDTHTHTHTHTHTMSLSHKKNGILPFITWMGLEHTMFSGVSQIEKGNIHFRAVALNSG